MASTLPRQYEPQLDDNNPLSRKPKKKKFPAIPPRQPGLPITPPSRDRLLTPGVAPFLQGERKPAPSPTEMIPRPNTSLPASPSVSRTPVAAPATQSLDRRTVTPLTPEALQRGQQLPMFARHANPSVSVPAQQAIYNNNDTVDMQERGNLVRRLNAAPDATFDPRTLSRSQRESLPASMARRGDYSYINEEREQRLKDKYARPYYDDGPMSPEDAQKRLEESERAYDNGTPLPEGHIGRTYIPFEDRSPAVQQTALPLEGTRAAEKAKELGMPVRTRGDMMNDYRQREVRKLEANELSRQRNEDAIKARTLGVPPALFTMRREQAESARNLERQQLERQDREAQTAREHELKIEEIKARSKTKSEQPKMYRTATGANVELPNEIISKGTKTSQLNDQSYSDLVHKWDEVATRMVGPAGKTKVVNDAITTMRSQFLTEIGLTNLIDAKPAKIEEVLRKMEVSQGGGLTVYDQYEHMLREAELNAWPDFVDTIMFDYGGWQ